MPGLQPACVLPRRRPPAAAAHPPPSAMPPERPAPPAAVGSHWGLHVLSRIDMQEAECWRMASVWLLQQMAARGLLHTYGAVSLASAASSPSRRSFSDRTSSCTQQVQRLAILPHPQRPDRQQDIQAQWAKAKMAGLEKGLCSLRRPSTRWRSPRPSDAAAPSPAAPGRAAPSPPQCAAAHRQQFEP
jgi:hypothetical protein